MTFNQRRVRLSLTIGAMLAVAGGTGYWATRPAVPFDEAFQECEEEEAEWRLIVTYTTDGLPDLGPFIACFRQREPSKFKDYSGSWFRWREPTVDEWEDVGGPGIVADFRHSLCIGSDGKWCCVGSWFDIAQNAEGVDLTIEQGNGGDEDSVVAETISLPFPRTVRGCKGKIRYEARWEEIPEAES